MMQQEAVTYKKSFVFSRIRESELVSESSDDVVIAFVDNDAALYRARSDRREILLDNLDDGRLFLKKPINVTFEEIDNGEIIAVFSETGIAMSGNSYLDAISALRDQIVDFYFICKKERKLGPELKRRFDVLGGYVGEKRGK